MMILKERTKSSETCICVMDFSITVKMINNNKLIIDIKQKQERKKIQHESRE